MDHLIAGHFNMQTVMDTSHCTGRNGKRLCSNHPTRNFICDSQNHSPASLVRKSCAIIYQLLKLIAIFSRLEFKVLVFGTSLKQFIYLCRCCRHSQLSS